MHPASPATTVFDSVLFRDAFGTPGMREVFSDHALIGRYVEVEIALAKAEAKCGVIPVEAADAIARQADASSLDLDRFAPGDRQCRLSDPASGSPDRKAMRRCRPLRALGRDDAGHHGHGRRPPAARWPEADRRRHLDASRACWPISRGVTATRPWPAAPIYNKRCRSPSDTRRRSGLRCSTVTQSACNN